MTKENFDVFQLKKSTVFDSRKDSKPTILNLNQITLTHILFIPLRYYGELQIKMFNFSKALF